MHKVATCNCPCNQRQDRLDWYPGRSANVVALRSLRAEAAVFLFGGSVIQALDLVARAAGAQALNTCIFSAIV